MLGSAKGEGYLQRASSIRSQDYLSDPEKGALLDRRHTLPSETSEAAILPGKAAHIGKPPTHLQRQPRMPSHLKACLFLVVNIVSATCIVFANKAVFAIFNFHFVYALTLLHVLTTLVGMYLFSTLGFFERKRLPIVPLLSISCAFVGYIVFWNISLQVNTVGFYQLSKICITPAVLVFDAVTSKKLPTQREIAAVVVLCVGVTLATVTDQHVVANLSGILVGIAAICFTAIYQVWVGSKQKQLESGSMQLLMGYSPIAALMLAVMVPIFEPIGLQAAPSPDTLLGFPYTPAACCVIGLTALLGLTVSLSTFLVIGATSSVTYNVVGHLKTVIVLAGGCLLFGEEMPMKRLLGVMLALSGIFWYSALKLQAQAASPSKVPSLPPSIERESLLRHSRSQQGLAEEASVPKKSIGAVHIEQEDDL